MLYAIQERVDAIPKENSTLKDGLVAYDALKEVEEKICQLSHECLKTDYDRRNNERELGLWRKIKADTLSHQDLAQVHTCVERWIQAGYDRSFISSDPDAVYFFGASDFRPIDFFKNAQSQLSDENMDLGFDRELGKVLFKIQGCWKTYAEIKEKIKFDKTNNKFIGWTYKHPDGFVPVDPTEWTSLYPYAQLSIPTYNKLRRLAAKFWSVCQPEIDPDVEKPCFLQILVFNKDFDKPCSPLLKNVKKMANHHCLVRLGDANRGLYCFGLWKSKKDLDFVSTNKRPGFTFHTANACLSVPDPGELIKFCADSVTIPLSVNRFGRIKAWAEAINQNGGIRFCMNNRNCCRLAQEVLSLTGVNLDTRLSLPQVVLAGLPDSADLPYGGRFVGSLSHGASFLYSKIQSVIVHTPTPIRYLFALAGRITLCIPKMLLTTASSFLCLALGGSRGNELKMGNPGNEEHDCHQIRLINSISDIFREKTSVVYHSHVLRVWVKKQGSYQQLENPVPQCIVVQQR